MPTTILTHGRVTWTNIVHPTPEDMQELAERYPNFHPLHLGDCLTELEFPKLAAHEDYIFLVVQMPIWDAGEQVARPAEVDIFVAQGTLVTSHRNDLAPLVAMFERLQADQGLREGYMGEGASPLLYHLLSDLVENCFPIVHGVYSSVKQLERCIFEDDTRRLLHDMAIVRRNTITMRSILKLQKNVVDALVRGTWPFIHQELDPYWQDLVDHLSQLCLMLDEYAEVVDGLSDTIDTLASHRIDEVVRLLTIVTVITLPLTLLATVFGMNIVMPYAEHSLLFYTVIGVGLVFTGWLVWFLRRRRWW